MKSRIALIAGAVMTLAGTANAADIQVNPPTVDRGASVWVTGELQLDDSQRFAAEVDRFRLPAQTTVVLEGPGGSVIAGLQIGELIHKRGWATMVYTGRICASACATAWLAGSPRYLYPQSHVGFHAAYNTLTGQQTGWTNALVGAYMTRLGLDYTAVRYVTIAAPESVTWLTATAAADYGIAVQELDEQKMSDPIEAFIESRTEPSKRWLRAHRDLLTDQRKSFKLTAAHNDALAEGLVPDTDAYFEHVERFMGLRAAPPVKAIQNQPKGRCELPKTVSDPGFGHPIGSLECR